MTNRTLLLACIGTTALIVGLDWLTSAGVVVGILLCVPIVGASLGDRSRDVWIVCAIALVGFAFAALFGRGPVSPPAVWAPNRAITFAALAASGFLALRIQKGRLDAERAREAADRSRDSNRILLLLLAHDLHSPLVLAIDTVTYVKGAARSSEAIDGDLLQSVEERLTRNAQRVQGILRLVESWLEVRAPGPGDRAGPEPEKIDATGAEVADALRGELRAFGAEADFRGMRLGIEISGDERLYRVDGLLIRQAASILVDNAIRHGAPGIVKVSGHARDGELLVAVENNGSAHEESEPESGSGLGLALCRALVALAGGRLEGEPGGAEGTVYELRLPLERSTSRTGRSGAAASRDR